MLGGTTFPGRETFGLPEAVEDRGVGNTACGEEFHCSELDSASACWIVAGEDGIRAKVRHSWRDPFSTTIQTRSPLIAMMMKPREKRVQNSSFLRVVRMVTGCGKGRGGLPAKWEPDEKYDGHGEDNKD